MPFLEMDYGLEQVRRCLALLHSPALLLRALLLAAALRAQAACLLHVPAAGSRIPPPADRNTPAQDLTPPRCLTLYHASAATACQAVADLKAAGKSEREIDAFTSLFTEVRQQIDSKQLRPFIRTQYMRTAFQVRHVRALPRARIAPRARCPARALPCALPLLPVHLRHHRVTQHVIPSPATCPFRFPSTPPCASAWTPTCA